MSLLRSRISTYPSGCRTARSPVRKQPLRVASPRRRGGACGEGDQERYGRAECEPRAGVRGPTLGKWEMDACVHLGPPRLGRVIVVEGDGSKTTIFLH